MFVLLLWLIAVINEGALANFGPRNEHALIALSPELEALLARDPIPDHSPIKALDHLLGKVFTSSKLLDWAHNQKPAVSATDPGRSIVADVPGISLVSGYKSRADWLAGLKQTDLAANGKGLFTDKTLFSSLLAPAPQGVTVQSTLSRPDFVQMVKEHQAWIAKNFSGFYNWQAKVEKQVNKLLKQEDNHGLGQIVGLIVAAVVVIVLTVVSYGWFAPVGTAILSTFTGAVAVSATAAVAVGAAVVGSGIAFAGAFLSTIIATGDFGKALEMGAISGAIALVTVGLDQYLHIGTLVQQAVGSVETALQTSSAAVNTVIDDAVQAVGQSATAAARGFENSVFGSLTQEIMTGNTGKNLLSQWGFGALLAGATAAVAFTIGDIIPWDKIGGPQVDTALTQKLEPGQIAYYSVATYNSATGMDTLDPQLRSLTGLTEVPDNSLATWILNANGVNYAANASAQTQQEAVTLSINEFADNYISNQAPSVQYQTHPDQYTLVPYNPGDMPAKIAWSDELVPYNLDNPQNVSTTNIWGQPFIAVYTGPPPSTTPTLDPIMLGVGGALAENAVTLAGAGSAASLPGIADSSLSNIALNSNVLAAETGTTLADDLAAAATRAAQNVGPGSGPVYGTQVHTAFEVEARALGNPDLLTEQSYLNGVPVPRGMSGSVRLDVVNGPVNAPTSVFDLKTGSAILTPARIQQIQLHIPGGASVPVFEVRP